MEIIDFDVEDIISTGGIIDQSKGDLSDFLKPGDNFNGGTLF